MALFQIDGEKLILIKPRNFEYEKNIQSLIEKNLDTVFNCRFIASEFSTGAEHAGRIDTLAISEDNNPVIIEYKKVESSELINQSLFYLSWIRDHHGDFEIAVQKSLGSHIEVDWSSVRVICIAPGYKKYDLHAVKMMGANIELWKYRLFENGAVYLEEIFRRSVPVEAGASILEKNPKMVEAGKKAAITRATGFYSFEEHLKKVNKNIRELTYTLREYIMNLDESIEEVPKKFYIAYKLTQNFVCMEVKRKKIIIYLKMNPDDYEKLPSNARDVRNIGHYGTGDFELTIESLEDLEEAKQFIRESFERIGG